MRKLTILLVLALALIWTAAWAQWLDDTYREGPPFLVVDDDDSASDDDDSAAPPQENAPPLMKVQERLEAQEQQLQQMSSDIDALNAYLADKAAVKCGEAPEGFEQPPLEFYKKEGITAPLTKAPPVPAETPPTPSSEE